jgi:hypothetical protein
MGFRLCGLRFGVVLGCEPQTGAERIFVGQIASGSGRFVPVDVFYVPRSGFWLDLALGEWFFCVD